MTGLEVARASGVSPTQIVECAGNCCTRFAVGEGFPWPVRFFGQKIPHMAFFSSACLLDVLTPDPETSPIQ